MRQPRQGVDRRMLVALPLLMIASGCQLVASVDESRLAADADLNESVSDASDDLLDAGDDPRDAGDDLLDASVPDSSVVSQDASLPPECTDDDQCPQANDPCQRSRCRNGSCTVEFEPDGSSCVTDKCIVEQTCTAGRCLGGMARDCGELDSQCVSGVCDPQSGACVAEPLPQGTDCSTAYCRVNQSCDGRGTCGSGTERVCPSISCNTQTCSENERACVTDQRGCEIDNSCVADGATNPANECEECDPKKNPLGWTPKKSKSRCDDGLRCTRKDRCNAGVCQGEDNCRGDETCSRARNRCSEDDDDDDDDDDD